MTRRVVSICLPILGFSILAQVCALASAGTETRALSLERRVAAQRAIEQVYWNHRIWPKENPDAKPPLSEVMPDAAIQGKVEDYLEKSNALATFWKRPITAEQLQAEMDRMAKNSRDPQVLRDLFEALGNDPFIIAETLARQVLADRLLRNWYAYDERFHGELKSKAQAARGVCQNVACMESMGGEYQETTWRLRSEGHEALDERLDDGALRVNSEEWNDRLERLSQRLGGTPEFLPTLALSDLGETADGVAVTAVLAQARDVVTTATVLWRKTPFDTWWAAERGSFRADIGTLSSTFELPSAAQSGCVIDWSPTHVEVADPRFGHTAVWTGTEMIVWGGGVYYMNTGGRYNPSTDTWTLTSTGANVPAPRYHHTAVWTGTEMIVWGGYDDLTMNTGGRYNPSSNTWLATSTGANLPAPRDGHTAVWTGTEMIVWGGDPALNTGGRYNPSTNTWTATSTVSSPSGRRYHTAVWTGAQMIVWGGTNGVTSVNTGGRYNPSTDAWVATSTVSSPSARYLHTAVWTGTQMIVWSGLGGQGTGGRYNPTTDTWAATSTVSSPSGRRYHTAVWTGTQMIVWGGDGDGPFLNNGARYDPTADTWAATSMGANLPVGRSQHTAVWTGTEMIVWGGDGDWVIGSQLNTGGRYNPSTDTWVATSTGATVPAARAFHTAVSTGTEMIVWGGVAGDDNLLNTGGRYAPSTDTWVATSTVSSPSGRRSHTAVWTGTEMIVWGGNGPTTNTGGRYNPSTNTWLATSTGANLPAGRALHTAVWTGAVMIVWGGDPALNTGGRYVPSTNTWKATSTLSSPSGRRYHAAVWAGTEMIVWGGTSGVTALNTGGRYDPSVDTWVPTSTGAIVPVPRYAHTAVWTGTQMIVWGGYDDTNGLNTGGRYNPTADTWAATSTGANVPSTRTVHSAVWTGTQMIVWGGIPLTSSGGLYCVASCPTPATWYRDQDGDGYGAAAALACRQPVGFVALAGDCNDASAAQFPGNPEVCDGLDNNCDEQVDEGLAPSGTPVLTLDAAGADSQLSWTAVNGTGYDVVYGNLLPLIANGGDFTTTTVGCLEDDTPLTSATHGATPAAGAGFWYAVRPTGCGAPGSYDGGGAQVDSRDDEILASGNGCP